MMDDYSITDERLRDALYGLRQVNRWLGGYASVRNALNPLAARRPGQTLRLLDLGTGLADIPADLVRWGTHRGIDLQVTGVEANPATAAYARRHLDERLPPSLRRRVTIVEGDAMELDFEAGSFDVVMAALFLHHFAFEQVVRLLRIMTRLAGDGIVVSDLHRHPLAYWSIRVLGKLLPTSEMFEHDAPLSVRRGFWRQELVQMADEAGLADYRVQWRWAFRWVLTTL